MHRRRGLSFASAGIVVGALVVSVLTSSAIVAPAAHAVTAPTAASRVLFSEGSGSTAADSSGNGRSATLIGAAGWGTGPAGGAGLSLNGTIGSEADIAAGTVDTTRSFSVGAWFSTTNSSTLQTVVEIDGSQVGGVYLQTVNGHVRGAMFGADSASSALTIVDSNPYVVTANTWQQATISYDAVAKTMTLYVDGAAQGSASVGATFRAGGTVAVGRGLYNGAKVDPFSGRVADVRLLQTTTSAQRATEYAAVQQLRYTDGTGAVATDSSGYNHSATVNGAPLWMVGKQYPSALALDGSLSDNATAAQTVNTAGSYSVSAWVYANDPARQQTAVSIDGSQQSAFYLQLSGGGFCLCLFGADSTAAGLSAARSGPVNASTWYEVTGVIDAVAHTATLYVNGVLAQSVALPSQWSAVGSLVTGRGKYAGNPVDPWNGGVEDVRLYPVALPASAAANLAVAVGNSCDDPAFQAQVGTSSPNPQDPYGFGYGNETNLGWTGNTYAPFAYLSGAFFARGVPQAYTAVSPAICGTMYSFGIYTYGLGSSAPPPGSVNWTMAGGYLPAFTTSFTRLGLTVAITNFADKTSISGVPTELVHSRVTLQNGTGSTITATPQPSAGLIAQVVGSSSIAPGSTSTWDYVVGVDTFGTGLPVPGPLAIGSQAPSFDNAFTAMSAYWNSTLSTLPVFSLPNVQLPDTGLTNPAAALTNAFKAAEIYTKVIQVGAAPYSAQNNYYAVLEHDAPVIEHNAFTQGDFTDAQQKLLEGRQASGQNYDPHEANQYFDGQWKTPQAWATYLETTGDTTFVSRYFHDDATTPSDFGPSLYTQMHTLVSMLNTSGYLPASFDNDSTGTWLFDDYAGMLGLASYRYIATTLGQSSEASWASQQLSSLMASTNTALARNQSASGFSYLPCEVPNPNSANRCNAPTDANWASALWFGQNAWDLFLAGGTPSGLIGDPSQVDNTYDYGYARLAAANVPYPSMGAFNGYTTAYNTAYALGSLFGSRHRNLTLTSYAWQIQNGQGGPNSFWEAANAPDPNNPWAGSHPTPAFGASPYAFPLAGQMLGLTQAVVATGLDGSTGTYTRPLYIGRGVPDQWIVAGQTIGVNNLTASYTASTRSTYAVSLSTATVGGVRQVTVSITGTPPAGAKLVQLPIFTSVGVKAVTGGTYTNGTVSMSGATTTVTLNS